MSWTSILSNIIYYGSLPFITLFYWLLVPLAPAIYLGNYLAVACLYPLTLVGKFETIYIYLGVATLVGLFSGAVLHTCSSLLVAVFSLNLESERNHRSVASVRAVREEERLEQAWQNSTPKSEDHSWRNDISMEKYAEWLERDAGQRRDEQGLLGQTILEEDGDSDFDF